MQIAEAIAPVIATPASLLPTRSPIVAMIPGAMTEYVGSSMPPYQPGHHDTEPSRSKIAARVAWAAKSGTWGTRMR